ncbi:uncharacterized protein LOC143225435 isoform X3 [Tachypleus tridentatus]
MMKEQTETKSSCLLESKKREGNEEDSDGLDWDPEDIAHISEPPNGGWGWMIVLASFLCNMVVDGVSYSFGIFLMDFVSYYGSPKGKTAWIGSLLSGGYLSSGVIVSGLTNRFGCRPVTIAGSLIACLAFLLSTVAPSVDVLMFTYGFMGGIGFGLIYLPAIVSVSIYFSTKRGVATGIAVCGSGMGAFVFPPVCQKLLETYDWKGAVLILAGLSLNCVVFGALMRPLDPPPPRDIKPLLQRIAEDKERQRSTSMYNSQYILVQRQDGTFEKFPLHHREELPRLNLNNEPGVQSTLYLDDVSTYHPEAPLSTLSPIEEARKSPSSSKEDDSETKTTTTGKTSSDTTEQRSRSLNDLSTQLLSDENLITVAGSKVVNNGTINKNEMSETDCQKNKEVIKTGIVQSALVKQIVKEKGLSIDNNSADLCLSNLAVNKEQLDRRRSSVRFASGSLYPVKTHSEMLDSMMKRLRGGHITTCGSRRSSLKPQSYVVTSGGSRRSSLRSRRSSVRYDRRELARPLYRKDIFYSGSIAHLPQYVHSQRDVRSFVASVTSIPRKSSMVDTVPSFTEGKIEGRCSWFHLPSSFSSVIREMLDFSLIKNPVFFVLCLSNVFGMMGFYIPFVYITDSSVVKGISREKAAFLLSIIGIMNTLGRLIFGWIADRPRVSALFVNNICLTLGGISVFIVPFCSSYITVVASAVCFGLFI